MAELATPNTLPKNQRKAAQLLRKLMRTLAAASDAAHELSREMEDNGLNLDDKSRPVPTCELDDVSVMVERIGDYYGWPYTPNTSVPE